MNTSWRHKSVKRITYATRGMEPMRAFPQFVESIDTILQRESNVEIIIAGGNDRVAYGSKSFPKNKEHLDCGPRKNWINGFV